MRAAWIKNGFRLQTWIAFKQHSRWASPRLLSVSPHLLVRCRRLVTEAFEQWKKTNSRPEDRLGFVPRTFAVWALDQQNIKLKKIADDDVVLDFALYQTIRVFSGTYESGPLGTGHLLKAIYTNGVNDP